MSGAYSTHRFWRDFVVAVCLLETFTRLVFDLVTRNRLLAGHLVSGLLLTVVTFAAIQRYRRIRAALWIRRRGGRRSKAVKVRPSCEHAWLCVKCGNVRNGYDA